MERKTMEERQADIIARRKRLERTSALVHSEEVVDNFRRWQRETTDEEKQAQYEEFINRPQMDLRALVEYIETHPGSEGLWDSNTMSFYEFAERVKRGDFD